MTAPVPKYINHTNEQEAMNIIEVKQINKYFGDTENQIHILKNIDLDIRRGDFVAIVGQSGSGKSTLMNILGCLDVASSGSYKIDGAEIINMSADQMAQLRREKFGFVFQKYNLLNTLTTLDNVALPAVYSGLPYKQRCSKARLLLNDLGLVDKLHNRPNQLSGGQQQRVSIARALMNGGEVILADEPTGALDSESGEVVMAVLQLLHQKGHTIILVTHNKTIANSANRIIEIKDGKIIADERTSPLIDTSPLRVANETKIGSAFFYFKDQFIESFKMSLQAIVFHKLRSLLSMLGIIIGIASVVSVVALGRGSQEKIMSDISMMGTNMVTIYPGAGFGDINSSKVDSLSESDANLLKIQSYLSGSSPENMVHGSFVYRNVSVNAQLIGSGEQYFEIKGLSVGLGRLYNLEDVKSNASVVVLDENTANTLFPFGQNPLGQIVLFNKKPLEVIGITKKQESQFEFGGNLNAWSPYTTVMNKINGSRRISSIVVKAKEGISATSAEQDLTAFLIARHAGKKDFYTENTDSVQKTIERATGTMTLLISSIAVISLVVGGVGVMNIMLVSVTERTKEIGLRMAIGARKYNILEQFLIEAVLICLSGGIVGVLLSYLIVLAFNSMSNNFVMSFSLGSIIAALCCSILTGVIFGFMPAKNASKLSPIEALSRE